LGSASDPAEGPYSAPPHPLAGFKGPTSNGRKVEGKEKGGKEKCGVRPGGARGPALGQVACTC